MNVFKMIREHKVTLDGFHVITLKKETIYKTENKSIYINLTDDTTSYGLSGVIEKTISPSPAVKVSYDFLKEAVLLNGFTIE